MIYPVLNRLIKSFNRSNRGSVITVQSLPINQPLLWGHLTRLQELCYDLNVGINALENLRLELPVNESDLGSLQI